MSLDVESLRAETPACYVLNHLNNAGASPAARPVLDAVAAHLRAEALEGPMEAAEKARAAAESRYASAARLLGCDTEEVAMVGGQSRGFQLAFAGVRLRRGDRIITSPSEWGGNYVNLRRAAARTGASVEIAPVEASGALDVTGLANMLDERVRLVSLTWVPANGGLIDPVAAVGRLLSGSGIFFFVDAAQVVGQMPVDVREVDCDVLTASGRKWLRGPRGTGLLYVRRSVLGRLEPPLLDVFSAPWSAEGGFGTRRDARRYETSERSLALEIGLGVAIDYALQLGLDRIRDRVARLASTARVALSEVPGVTIRDLGEEPRAGLVSFTLDGCDGAAVRAALARSAINVGLNGAGYTPADMAARGLSEVLRVSPHYFNTEAEIEAAVDAVAQVARA